MQRLVRTSFVSHFYFCPFVRIYYDILIASCLKQIVEQAVRPQIQCVAQQDCKMVVVWLLREYKGTSIDEGFIIKLILYFQAGPKAGYSFSYCLVKQRTICIINVRSYTEILPQLVSVYNFNPVYTR